MMGVPAGEDEAAREHKPGVTRVPKPSREASIFCREQHRDGTGARRVAVLQKQPRRLVTDDENVPWPGVPGLKVVASCRACWQVLCDQCREAGKLTGNCEHSQRGDWQVEVAKIKAQLARSNRNVNVRDVLWVPPASPASSTL